MSVPLRRGRRINLMRAGGRHIPLVRLSLGWTAAPRLDAHGHPSTWQPDLESATVLCARAVPVDLVFFRNRTTADGSVQQRSDSPTAGTGSRSDESVLIDLRRLPQRVDQLAFVAASFTGQTYEEIAPTNLRLTDEHTGEELAHYSLIGGGRHTAQVMVSLHRSGPAWQLTALGTPLVGRSFQEFVPSISASLR